MTGTKLGRAATLLREVKQRGKPFFARLDDVYFGKIGKPNGTGVPTGSGSWYVVYRQLINEEKLLPDFSPEGLDSWMADAEALLAWLRVARS